MKPRRRYGISRTCRWHHTGVPAEWAPRRWFSPGCVRCLAKKAAGLCDENDPDPATLQAARHRNGIKGEVAKRMREIALVR